MSHIEKILAGFLSKDVLSIVGIPNYKTIKELNLLLSANAASVHSNHGNGSLGHLALTVSTVVHNTLAGCDFSAPTNPGATVDVPVNAMASQTAALERTHKAVLKDWDTYNSVDGALKQQLLTSVHPTYYRGLHHRYTGYGQVNTSELLVHLYTTYGEIGPDNLEENEKRMRELYDATEEVEVLFDQIEDAVRFTNNAAQPYTDLQVLRVAFNLMFDTRQFTRSCEKFGR